MLMSLRVWKKFGRPKKVLDILENLLEYCNHAEWQNDLGKWTIILGINVGRRIKESTCVNENIMRKYYLELSVFVAPLTLWVSYLVLVCLLRLLL